MTTDLLTLCEKYKSLADDLARNRDDYKALATSAMRNERVLLSAVCAACEDPDNWRLHLLVAIEAVKQPGDSK